MRAEAEKLKKFFIKNAWMANIVYPLIGVGVILLIWVIGAAAVGMEMILPTPSRAFEEFFKLLKESEFWLAVGNTLARTILSFVLGFLAAAVTATLSAFVKPAGRIIAPIITVLRSVPTMSIILIAVIALRSTQAPVLVTFLIVYPLLHSSFERALENVDPYAVNMSKVFGVPIYKRVFKLYIPAVLPDVFAASKSNFSLALKVMIASEVLAQTFDSMGVNMQISRIYLDTAQLMGWTLAAIIMSFALEGAVSLLKRFTVRWK